MPNAFDTRAAANDTAQYYKDRFEDLQRTLENQAAEREREAERRRKARAAEAEEDLHFAETWEEAFRKGLTLIRREARSEAEDNARWKDEADWEEQTYFKTFAEETERAAALYAEEMQKAEEEIKRLRSEARRRAAARLRSEFPESVSGLDLATALDENAMEYLLNW